MKGVKLRNHTLGLIALLLGAAALVFAILAENQRIEAEKEARVGAVEKLKDFAASLIKGEPTAGESPSQPVYKRLSPIMMATIGAAILGLVLGPVSWVREKQPILSCSAMGLSAAALLWHYILIGVAVAVAVILIPLIVANLDL